MVLHPCAEHLARVTGIHRGHAAFEGGVGHFCQGGQAGVEHHVADFHQRVTLHLQKLGAGRDITDQHLDHFQALVLGKDQQGITGKHAAEGLADAVHRGTFLAQVIGHFADGDEVQLRHAEQHFVLEHLAHRGGCAADANVEHLAEHIRLHG